MNTHANTLDRDLRQHCARRMKELDREQASWVAHWRELSDYILPRRGRFLYAPNASDKGRKLNSRIINSTGTLAARTLSSGLMSGVTSPARPWFRLTLSDKQLAREPEVRTWLDQVQDTMLRIFAASNLYNALGTVYEELAVFGTAALLVLEDYEDVVRGYTLTVGEYWLACNERGVVDTLYRRFPLTVHALVQAYGIENVSEQVRARYRNGSLDHEVMVIHAIEPNDRRVVDAPDARNMPWRSVHFEQEGGGDELLRVSGFKRFSVMCPRWHVTGNDVYGRSQGMDALPDIKALQSMEKDKAKSIALMNKPPMGASPQLRNEQHGTVPGSVTYTQFDASGRPGFRPLFEVNPRINEMMLDIQAKERQVNAAFFADIFLMMSQLDDVRSATEILERREEKMVMLGPVLERLHDELLDPLIKRVMEIAEHAGTAERGVMPARPRALRGHEIEVDYVSTLSVAQRATGTASIERLVAFAGRVGAARPEVLDKLDLDEAIDAYSELVMAPSKLVVPTKVVARQRAARAEAMAQKQAVEQTIAGVQAAKVASEIDVGGGRTAVQAALGG